MGQNFSEFRGNFRAIGWKILKAKFIFIQGRTPSHMIEDVLFCCHVA